MGPSLGLSSSQSLSSQAQLLRDESREAVAWAGRGTTDIIHEKGCSMPGPPSASSLCVCLLLPLDRVS